MTSRCIQSQKGKGKTNKQIKQQIGRGTKATVLYFFCRLFLHSIRPTDECRLLPMARHKRRLAPSRPLPHSPTTPFEQKFELFGVSGFVNERHVFYPASHNPSMWPLNVITLSLTKIITLISGDHRVPLFKLVRAHGQFSFLAKGRYAIVCCC